jgi:hypothetical protein
MNNLWRTILRARALASVTIHRKPPRRAVALINLGSSTNLLPLHSRVSFETKPYIHILFRSECAESWMTQLVSNVPKTPVDWLARHGFGAMEYFDIKVGVAPAGLSRQA